jgi:hypothetical protein
MPRSRSAGTIVSTGSTRPVGLVTWSISSNRVRSVTAASTASCTACADGTGTGIATVTMRAPLRAAT